MDPRWQWGVNSIDPFAFGLPMVGNPLDGLNVAPVAYAQVAPNAAQFCKPPVRRRWNIDDDALQILEEVFEKEAYPDRRQLKKLADKFEVTCRQVQVWFQNKRAIGRKGSSRPASSAASTTCGSTHSSASQSAAAPNPVRSAASGTAILSAGAAAAETDNELNESLTSSCMCQLSAEDSFENPTPPDTVLLPSLSGRLDRTADPVQHDGIDCRGGAHTSASIFRGAGNGQIWAPDGPPGSSREPRDGALFLPYPNPSYGPTIDNAVAGQRGDVVEDTRKRSASMAAILWGQNSRCTSRRAQRLPSNSREPVSDDELADLQRRIRPADIAHPLPERHLLKQLSKSQMVKVLEDLSIARRR